MILMSNVPKYVGSDIEPHAEILLSRKIPLIMKKVLGSKEALIIFLQIISNVKKV